MPKYRLTIEREDNYTEVDWSILLEKEYKNITTELINIDKFTTKFSNSDELKWFLYGKGIIDNVKGKLCITYKSKGEDKKLSYGLSYFEDKPFLRRSYLITYINEKIDELDVKFFNRLINKYKDNPIHYNDVIIIRNFIESINNNKVTQEKISYMKNTLTRFVDKETLKYNFTKKDFERDNNGNFKVAYKDLRELGRMCSNYYHRVDEKIEEYDNKASKVKVIDKKQIPGQLDFFDQI